MKNLFIRIKYKAELFVLSFQRVIGELFLLYFFFRSFSL